jgi:hypothetical protein
MWEFRKNGHSGVGSAEKFASPPDLRLSFPTPPGGPSDGSSRTLQRPVTEFDYELWNLGWVDGRLGQPIQENEAVLKAYADIRRTAEVEATRRRIAQLRSQIEKDDELLGQTTEALKKATQRHETIEEQRGARLQEYSLLLGLVYLLVGCILFLSDIPLSLHLVAEGYDIPVEAVLADGSPLSVEDLFVRPIAVIQHLWEPLVLALGFALAGVFVKIFIDEVIWKPKSEGSSLRLRIFLSFTGILFLCTLVAVGVFRSERQAQKAASPSGFSLNFATQMDDSSATPPSAGASIGSSDEVDWGWGFWSFLSITLMLPIIGGICFLAGSLRVQNWSFLRECRRSRGGRMQSYSVISEQMALKKGELAAFEESLARLEKDVGPQVDLWKHLYRHGYWRGHAVPESIQDQEDLYTRLDKMFAKEIAADARTRFWREAGTT